MKIDIKIFNQDCMEAMKQMPDKAFDLAIVDPPYGIGADKQKASESYDPINGGRCDRPHCPVAERKDFKQFDNV